MSVDPWTQTPVYTVSGIGPYAITHPYAPDAIQAMVVVSGVRVFLDPTQFSLSPISASTSGNLYLTPAAAATHAGRSLIIDRVTPDQQGWVAALGEREAGLAAQLDRMVQAAQEIRAALRGTVRIRAPLDAFDWADGTVPIRSGNAVISGPTAAQIIASESNALTAANAAIAAAASADAAEAKQNSMLADAGVWGTGIFYSKSQLFTDSGRTYITQIAHFATTVAADLTANRIRVFADKGAAGAGTGDMLKSEFLSGLSNYPLARANLGLGALATLNLLGFPGFDPAAIISDIEGLAGNKLANALPTAKTVADYVDATVVPATPIASYAWSANTTIISLINLTGWDEVEIRGELTGNGYIGMQVSPDNGTTVRVAGYDSGVDDPAGSINYTDTLRLNRGSGSRRRKFSVQLMDMASATRRTNYTSECRTAGVPAAGFIAAIPAQNDYGVGEFKTPEICTAVRIVGQTVTAGYIEIFGVRRAPTAIVGDVTGPTIVSTSPADNAIGVTLASNLAITFSEAVVFGAGLIILRQNIAGMWTDLETFNVFSAVGSGAGQMNIAGSLLTINPTADLVPGREYAVRVAPTALRDAAGNGFVGIADDVTFSFTAAVATGAPTFITLTVANDLITYRVSGPATFRYSFDDVAAPTAAPIAAGTGAYAFGSFDTAAGTNDVVISKTGVPAGARKLHIVLSNVGGSVYDTPYHFDVTVAAADATAPTLISSSPADNAVNVALSANLTLTFSENVVPGTGVLTLRQNIAGTWSDVETFNVLSSVGTGPGQVSFAGAVVTLNPTGDLTSSREYAVRVAATAVKDAAGNAFAGIANDTTVSFTAVAADSTPPTLTSSSPADNATSVALAVSPTLTFSEPVVFGTGVITLRQNIAGTWSDVEQFDVVTEVGTSNGQVSISGGIVTINPTADLTPGREYAIRVASTAIKDAANNAFAGIANDTTVSFTATASNPELLVDPGFADASKWNVPTGMAITGGELVFSSPAAFTPLEATGFQWAPVSPSTLYKYGIDITNLTGGAGLRVRFEVIFWKGTSVAAGAATPASEQLGGSTVTISATGRLEYNFTTPSDCTYVQYSVVSVDTGCSYHFDNASIKAV